MLLPALANQNGKADLARAPRVDQLQQSSTLLRRILRLSAGKSQDGFALFATSIGGRSENTNNKQQSCTKNKAMEKKREKD